MKLARKLAGVATKGKGFWLTFGAAQRKEEQSNGETDMAAKTVDDMALAGKTVLTRVDINVPIEGGVVTDTTRIDKIRSTVEDIIARGGKVVLLAHFDRPKGKVVPDMSLSRIVTAVQGSLGRKIVFGSDCIGDPARRAIAEAAPGDVVLLENTRFHAGEEKNDPAFAAELALLGDVFVNDAFSAAHRAHASTAALAHLLPSAAGRLMEAELPRWRQPSVRLSARWWRLSAAPRFRPSWSFWAIW